MYNNANFYCSEIGKIAESCLLDGKVFSEALESHGHDVTNLAKPLTTPGSKTKTSKKVFVYKSSLNIGQYCLFNACTRRTTRL